MADNVATLLRAVEQFNARDVDAYIETLYAEEVVLHGYPAGVEGKASLRNYYTWFVAAFTEVRLSVDETIVDGDRLAGRFTVRGRQTDGQYVVLGGVTLMHFADGRVVERWQATVAPGSA